jgi:hypothetical protein
LPLSNRRWKLYEAMLMSMWKLHVGNGGDCYLYLQVTGEAAFLVNHNRMIRARSRSVLAKTSPPCCGPVVE